MSTNPPQYVAVEQCPLCASRSRSVVYEGVEDYKYKVPGNWSFVKCIDCGAVYLDPMLADPMEGYPSGYSQHKQPQTPGLYAPYSWKGIIRRSVLYSLGYRELGCPWFGRVIGRVLGSIPFVRLKALWGFLLVPKALPGGRLLDIGCGNGRFLAAMRALGWEVMGVEPDPVSRSIAESLTGAPVLPSLAEAQFPANFFDIITMNHVLEHISEPTVVLRECWRILKPGGMLGLCVPNWDSLTRRIFGKYCYHLEPPRHVVMYEPDSLGRLLVSTGFEIHSLKTTSVRERRNSFKQSWQFHYGRYPPRLLLAFWEVLSILINFVSSTSGEEIVVWAKKPQEHRWRRKV